MFWSRPLAGRQRRRDQAEDFLRGIGLDVHHPGLQAGGLGDGDAVLDLFLARRGDQDLDLVGVVRRWAQDLEIEVDLVQREGDVLVGLGLDGKLEFLFLLAGRDDDLFGDDHRGRQRHGNIAVAAAEAFPAPLERIADLVQVGDVAVGDKVLRQWLDRIPFEPVSSLAGLREFDQFDRRRRDVDSNQGRRLGFEDIEHSGKPFGNQGVLWVRMLIIYIKLWQQV